jgi:3-dehydroquinate dehydratase type I
MRLAPSKICASIGAPSLKEMEQKAELAVYMGADLVELRIDTLMSRTTAAEIASKLKRFARRAVITVRSNKEGGRFYGSEIERLGLISSLAEMRPAYLDIELSTAEGNSEWLGSIPRRVERIASWHSFQGTPDIAELRATCERALKKGSIAKVVTTATKMEDNLPTLRLCAERPGEVVSFCMGELGAVSRILSMRMSAPLAYASVPGEPLAPGQIPISTMKEFRDLARVS